MHFFHQNVQTYIMIAIHIVQIEPHTTNYLLTSNMKTSYNSVELKEVKLSVMSLPDFYPLSFTTN